MLARDRIAEASVLEYVRVSYVYLLMQTFRHLSPHAIKVFVYITQLIYLQRLFGSVVSVGRGVARDDIDSVITAILVGEYTGSGRKP
jgi:hypothetical protein